MSGMTLQGKDIQFSNLNGKVMATENKEQAIVSTKGSITGEKSIETNIYRSSSFWLRTESGHEKEFNLDSAVSMREGHDVTIIFVGKKGYNTRYIAKIINHTTGETTQVTSEKEMLRDNLGIGPSPAIEWGTTILPWLLPFLFLKSFFDNGSMPLAGYYFLIALGAIVIGTPFMLALNFSFNSFYVKKYKSEYISSLEEYMSNLHPAQ